MKRTYLFVIKKNPERQGAWLLVWERNLVVPDLDEVAASSGASAWTTLAAAKRAAARMLNRSRLPWTQDDDILRSQVTVRE
jgi:hypothetical protein